MKTGSHVSVWSGERAGCIKVSGRANFSASIDFKSGVGHLCELGCHHIVLDLTDCLLMDSTFVGVLAGLGRLSESPPHPWHQDPIEIVNPNARIADLLDNLGVRNLFRIVEGPAPDCRQMKEVELPSEPASDRALLSRTCLEAHQTLMEVNPANAKKFQDVTRCLEEEIKRNNKNQT